MAIGKKITITKVNVNNSKATSTVSQSVEQVVEGGILIADPSQINRGVVSSDNK